MLNQNLLMLPDYLAQHAPAIIHRLALCRHHYQRALMLIPYIPLLATGDSSNPLQDVLR